MTDLQILKDIDDIDHLTVEKIEDDAHENIDHFTIRRIAFEKFSAEKAVKLLKHMAMWYPETEETVNQTNFTDTDSIYNSLRTVRGIIINSMG